MEMELAMEEMQTLHKKLNNGKASKYDKVNSDMIR